MDITRITEEGPLRGKAVTFRQASYEFTCEPLKGQRGWISGDTHAFRRDIRQLLLAKRHLFGLPSYNS